MLFDIHGLVLALHHDARFLRSPGAVARARAAFDRVLAYHASARPAVPIKATNRAPPAPRKREA